MPAELQKPNEQAPSPAEAEASTPSEAVAGAPAEEPAASPTPASVPVEESVSDAAEAVAPAPISMEEFLRAGPAQALDGEPVSIEDARLKAIIEAIVYVTEDPVTVEQLASGVGQPRERIQPLIAELVVEYDKPEHGVSIREVAGGYKVATKAEHHDAVQDFVKSLKQPLKLSLPALETLAVVAYKQPVTAPEIMEIRGVHGAGVLKTLLERKLIAEAGRKNVIGRPILYRTTKEFMVQFGLSDLSELPSLKELEEIRRMSVSDDAPEPSGEAPPAGVETAPELESGQSPAAAAEAPEASAPYETADAEPHPENPSKEA